MDDDYKLKLKPCPFCGGEACIKIKSFDVFTHGAIVECNKCFARTMLVVPSMDYAAKDKAAELWNRRVENE